MKMTVDEVLERARRMLGDPLLYWIGMGGRFAADDPASPPGQLIDVAHELAQLSEADRRMYLDKAQAAGIEAIPAQRVPACDCSNFSNWVLRIPHGAPGWMNTDAMHADASGVGRVFERLDRDDPLRARLGALLVYPRPADGSERFGHVGIVTGVDERGHATRVVHCSATNFLGTRNAIAEMGPEPFFDQPATMAVWCVHVER